MHVKLLDLTTSVKVLQQALNGEGTSKDGTKGDFGLLFYAPILLIGLTNKYLRREKEDVKWANIKVMVELLPIQ
jgi:hypothetical protein